MREVSTNNFGLLIAYLIPGFVIMLSLRDVSLTVTSWLEASTDAGPTVGGFLYATMASIMAGLIASTVRWLILDSLHHHTGIKQPAWEFSRLQQNVTAFDVMIEIHYRYYQFYGNTLVALLVSLAVDIRSWLTAVLTLALCVLFYLGSRDTLRKYYGRVDQMLSHPRNAHSAASMASGAVLPDQ